MNSKTMSQYKKVRTKKNTPVRSKQSDEEEK
jgi:hypothetical protein